MSFTNTLKRYDAELVELIARRPELRDVGIAGYLVGAAVDGGPGMPRGPFACDCGCEVIASAITRRWAA